MVLAPEFKIIVKNSDHLNNFKPENEGSCCRIV